MRGPMRIAALTAIAVSAIGALIAGSASGATMEKTVGEVKTPFMAIYGYPGASTKKPAVEEAIGGGLGRNFGFGENMLFQACSGCTTAVGTNLSITLAGSVTEAKDSFIGGRLMSNKTGVNNPLSFKIEFVDFQDNLTGGVLTPSYADTSDRPWIAEICSPAAVEAKCKTDAQFPQGNKPGGVKIENVSFLLSTAGGPIVVQGTVWGLWENGAAGKAPCIKLETPKEKEPTLAVTQTFTGGPELGALVTAVSGKACLISSNNDWYSVKAGEKEEPAITIANT